MRAYIQSIAFEQDPNPNNVQIRITTQIVKDDGTVVGFDAYASVDQDATLASMQTAVLTAVRNSSVGYGIGVIPANRVLMPSFTKG